MCAEGNELTATGNLTVEAQERYRYIQQLLVDDLSPPARVVELGSAPGDQIVQLASLGYDATSVDIGTSTEGWGAGQAGRMSQILADAGVADVKWDLEVAPYPLDDASFDAVIMTEVFEHLREYPITSLREIRRILAPGGRLYFTTPNAAYAMNRLQLLIGRSPATPLADWIGGIPHARHAREYTFAEIGRLFEMVGLDPVRVESRHFHLTSGKTNAAARLAKKGLDRLSRLRPTLGPSILVVAERCQTQPASGPAREHRD